MATSAMPKAKSVLLLLFLLLLLLLHHTFFQAVYMQLY